MILYMLVLVISAEFTNSIAWKEAVNEDDNPRGLKENTAMDNIEKANREDHTENTFKNIFEGDVELTESDREGVDTSDANSTDTAEVDVDSVVTKRKAISSRRHLWIRKVIPVELGPGASKAWSNILKAVQEIQKKSCVRFRMKKKGDENWIRFVKKNGCFSPVGRQYLKKGMQELSIGKGCNSKGIILHELMHALGFWHEQSRSDRQSYLEVLWENINPGQIHNFNRYKKKNLDFFGGSYDFSSIMHYGNYAFSKNKRPTMLSVKNPLLQFGQIAKLSPTDVLQLNALYDCRDSKKQGWSSWRNWSPCDTNCTKERERFCSADNIKKCPGADRDRIQIQKSKCPNKECYVPIDGHWGRWGPWSKCSRNCGQGYQYQSRKCDDPKPQYGGKYCSGPLVKIRPCTLRKSCKWRRKRITLITGQDRKSAVNKPMPEKLKLHSNRPNTGRKSS
ncbi:blastula protease 10-like [Porites lutea]|uniref:blastula protease 10-like n=1 Tax=Porites lutea TaxID=51062 RepID=UPI003CC5AAA1